MAETVCGISDGKKWIAGQFRLKKDETVYVDTRTGEGVGVVLDCIKDAIFWQARKMSLPGFDEEDIRQELTLIALLAIPDYNPDCGTTISTFLQGHLGRRAKNLYKFATEKRRTALSRLDRPSKVRCPECGRTHITDGNSKARLTCSVCGFREEKPWRRFPLQISALSGSHQVQTLEDEAQTIQDLWTYDDLFMMGSPSVGVESLENKIAISELANKQDGPTKLIIHNLWMGQTTIEAGKAAGLTQAAVRKRLVKTREQNDVGSQY